MSTFFAPLHEIRHKAMNLSSDDAGGIFREEKSAGGVAPLSVPSAVLNVGEQVKPGTPTADNPACVMLDLPADMAAELVKLAETIDPDHRAEKGVERTPHVTVKYGLTCSPEEVKAALAGRGPVEFRLGEFRTFYGDKHDVLYVDCIAPALHRLNRLLSALPCVEDTHKEYVPHITLAYIKRGAGRTRTADVYAAAWNGALQLNAQGVATELTYSGPDKVTCCVPLTESVPARIGEEVREKTADPSRPAVPHAPGQPAEPSAPVASPPPAAPAAKTAVRYVHRNGAGLMNNTHLNYDKLDDDEESEVHDHYLGLQQPPRELHGKPVVFAFTPEGEQKHQRLIHLLSKASKRGGVRREPVDLSKHHMVWESSDGQLGLQPHDAMSREKNFNPNEPRDARGEWTAGGAVAGKKVDEKSDKKGGGEDTPSNDGGPSDGRLRAIMTAAEKIQVSDEKISGGEPLDRPHNRRTFEAIEDILTDKEREEMESHIDSEKEKYLENVDPGDVELDDDEEREAAKDSGWNDDDIRDKAKALIDQMPAEWKEYAGEAAADEINDWYRDTGKVGVDAISELAKRLRKDDDYKDFAELVDGLTDDCETDVEAKKEEMLEEKKEKAMEDAKEEAENEFDADEPRREWLSAFYDENEDDPRISGESEAQEGVWGKDEDGDPVYHFSTSGGERYKAVCFQQNTPAGRLSEFAFSDADGSFKVTGAGNAHEVFGAVVPAAVAIITKNDMPAVTFTAAEPSRRRLYDRLVRTVAAATPGYAAVATVAGGVKRYVIAKRDVMSRILQSVSQALPGADVETVVKGYGSLRVPRGWEEVQPASAAEVDAWHQPGAWGGDNSQPAAATGDDQDDIDHEHPVAQHITAEALRLLGAQEPDFGHHGNALREFVHTLIDHPNGKAVIDQLATDPEARAAILAHLHTGTREKGMDGEGETPPPAKPVKPAKMPKPKAQKTPPVTSATPAAEPAAEQPAEPAPKKGRKKAAPVAPPAAQDAAPPDAQPEVNPEPATPPTKKGRGKKAARPDLGETLHKVNEVMSGIGKEGPTDDHLAAVMGHLSQHTHDELKILKRTAGLAVSGIPHGDVVEHLSRKILKMPDRPRPKNGLVEIPPEPPATSGLDGLLGHAMEHPEKAKQVVRTMQKNPDQFDRAAADLAAEKPADPKSAERTTDPEPAQAAPPAAPPPTPEPEPEPDEPKDEPNSVPARNDETREMKPAPASPPQQSQTEDSPAPPTLPPSERQFPVHEKYAGGQAAGRNIRTSTSEPWERVASDPDVEYRIHSHPDQYIDPNSTDRHYNVGHPSHDTYHPLMRKLGNQDDVVAALKGEQPVTTEGHYQITQAVADKLKRFKVNPKDKAEVDKMVGMHVKFHRPLDANRVDPSKDHYGDSLGRNGVSHVFPPGVVPQRVLAHQQSQGGSVNPSPSAPAFPPQQVKPNTPPIPILGVQGFDDDGEGEGESDESRTFPASRPKTPAPQPAPATANQSFQPIPSAPVDRANADLESAFGMPRPRVTPPTPSPTGTPPALQPSATPPQRGNNPHGHTPDQRRMAKLLADAGHGTFGRWNPGTKRGDVTDANGDVWRLDMRQMGHLADTGEYPHAERTAWPQNLASAAAALEKAGHKVAGLSPSGGRLLVEHQGGHVSLTPQDADKTIAGGKLHFAGSAKQEAKADMGKQVEAAGLGQLVGHLTAAGTYHIRKDGKDYYLSAGELRKAMSSKTLPSPHKLPNTRDVAAVQNILRQSPHLGVLKGVMSKGFDQSSKRFHVTVPDGTDHYPRFDDLAHANRHGTALPNSNDFEEKGLGTVLGHNPDGTLHVETRDGQTRLPTVEEFNQATRDGGFPKRAAEAVGGQAGEMTAGEAAEAHIERHAQRNGLDPVAARQQYAWMMRHLPAYTREYGDTSDTWQRMLRAARTVQPSQAAGVPFERQYEMALAREFKDHPKNAGGMPAGNKPKEIAASVAQVGLGKYIRTTADGKHLIHGNDGRARLYTLSELHKALQSGQHKPIRDLPSKGQPAGQPAGQPSAPALPVAQRLPLKARPKADAAAAKIAAVYKQHPEALAAVNRNAGWMRSMAKAHAHKVAHRFGGDANKAEAMLYAAIRHLSFAAHTRGVGRSAAGRLRDVGLKVRRLKGLGWDPLSFSDGSTFSDLAGLLV